MPIPPAMQIFSVLCIILLIPSQCVSAPLQTASFLSVQEASGRGSHQPFSPVPHPANSHQIQTPPKKPTSPVMIPAAGRMCPLFIKVITGVIHAMLPVIIPQIKQASSHLVHWPPDYSGSLWCRRLHTRTGNLHGKACGSNLFRAILLALSGQTRIDRSCCQKRNS